MNRAISRVSDDIEAMSFNTAVSELMICLNSFRKIGVESVGKASVESLLIIVAPFAPHITEELWYDLGNTTSIHLASWPVVDKKHLVSETINIPVQINGKVRVTLSVEPGISEKSILELAKDDEKAKSWIEKGKIKKVIYVQDKILNIVVA